MTSLIPLIRSKAKTNVPNQIMVRTGNDTKFFTFPYFGLTFWPPSGGLNVVYPWAQNTGYTWAHPSYGLVLKLYCKAKYNILSETYVWFLATILNTCTVKEIFLWHVFLPISVLKILLTPKLYCRKTHTISYHSGYYIYVWLKFDACRKYLNKKALLFIELSHKKFTCENNSLYIPSNNKVHIYYFK